MKILFIGCVESSYKLLEALLQNGKEVVGVITKERSDFNADFVDLQPLCEQYGTPVHTVNNINEEGSIDFVSEQSPDIGFCFGWSQLLKEPIINAFPKGVVGFHPAALPNNRGRHPLIWALALGLNETASSFFMINTGADEGDIVSQEKVSITYEDDARTLYDKIMDIAVKQEIELVDAFENNCVRRARQTDIGVNFWRKRGKTDGEIDWRMSSRSIYNLVRSLTHPYVGAHFVYNGNDCKVWKVKEINADGFENIEPGKILNVGNSSIDVKTGEGAIRLLDYEKINVKIGDYIL